MFFAELTCADSDGQGTPASCGSGASCSEGGSNDGYVCQCDAGFIGADVQNGPASCTGKVRDFAPICR